MLRSHVDRHIEAMRAACARHGVALPGFADWTPAQFAAAGPGATRIRDGGLGWNVAEFAPGEFERAGLVIFTTRMGDHAKLSSGRGRLYGEKALFARDRQTTPHHYHRVKTEDVINRGGGRFVVEIVGVDRAGEPTGEPVRLFKDEREIEVAPRGRVVLDPGESLVLEPYVAHGFRAEGGDALAVEISLANDDANDNYFLPPLGPQAGIVEDAPARFVTVADYFRLLAR
ncbi:MAG: D-lyxose/D-mannose family sugar isomerase [Hyphomicrobiales bacterium]|nr:D-lyxose/D-mannose family sugar isomerase [Hyphomicrobiales bacterium]